MLFADGLPKGVQLPSNVYPVENRSPYLAVSFIIALMSEFPSRN